MNPKQFKAKLGARAKARRKQLGLTLNEVAKRSRKSKSSIFEIESGHVDPQSSTVVKLTLALEISLRELLTGEDDGYARGYMAAVANMAAHIKGMKLSIMENSRSTFPGPRGSERTVSVKDWNKANCHE